MLHRIAHLSVCSLLLWGCQDAGLRAIPKPPPSKVGYQTSREVCTKTPKVDVVKSLDALLLVDTTGSMTLAIANLQDNLSFIVTELQKRVPDSRFGVARFDDYRSVCAVAQGNDDPADVAYKLLAPLSNDVDALSGAIANLTKGNGETAGGGADGLATGYEALYQAATGLGLDLDKDGVYDGDDALDDIAPMAAGWRSEARRAVVVVTDADFVDPESGPRPSIAARQGEGDWSERNLAIQARLEAGGAHGRHAAKDALVAAGIKTVGISVGTQGAKSFTVLRWLAEQTDTMTFVGFDAAGDGTYSSPGAISPGGPLVFRTDSSGNPYAANGVGSMSETIVRALADIANATTVTLTLDTAQAEGVEIDVQPALSLEGVPPETEVCFTLSARWPVNRKGDAPQVTVKVDSNGKAFDNVAVEFDAGAEE